MVPGESFHKKTGGLIGGGQFGFNLQVKQFVFGAEVTTDGTNLKTNNTSTFGAADDVFKTRINFLMTATARAWLRSWINFCFMEKAAMQVP